VIDARIDDADHDPLAAIIVPHAGYVEINAGMDGVVQMPLGAESRVTRHQFWSDERYDLSRRQ
jgi:hypothetical protein